MTAKRHTAVNRSKCDSLCGKHTYIYSILLTGFHYQRHWQPSQEEVSWFTLTMSSILTPLLPRCHLKTTHKNAKFETLNSLKPSFSHWHVKWFSSKHTALKTDVIWPETILFASVSMHHSAWTFFTGWVSGWVKGPSVHKYTGISVAQQNISKCVLIHKYVCTYTIK